MMLVPDVPVIDTAVDSADAQPTEAELGVYAELDQQLETQLAKWREVLSRDVPAFNDTMQKKNVPLIDLHAKSIELLDRLGPAISPALGPLKPDGTLDKTHLDEEGSALFGALMADEVRRVVPELAAHIRLASGARRATRAEHLRDEMREHLRLKEIGVLSAGEYETAKLHILDEHSPAQPPLARA